MTCSKVLAEQGKAYPRTCVDHGLGPCPPTEREVNAQLGIDKLADEPEGDPETDSSIDLDEPLEVERGPHLVLDLDGDHAVFEARGQKANQMLMVKHFDAIFAGGYAATNAVVKLALGQVKDRARLEQYLDDHGFAEDFNQQLYTALEQCWQGETMLPLAPSSGSSERTATT